MNDAKNKTRRRYGAELKQQILAHCAVPGASVARIALSHGINANVAHRCRRQHGGPLRSPQAPAFVAVPLPPAALLPELRRGAARLSQHCPLFFT